jgi:hypothetical protein
MCFNCPWRPLVLGDVYADSIRGSGASGRYLATNSRNLPTILTIANVSKRQ